MPDCVGCSMPTNMERPANDIPESEGKTRALASVYVPCCGGCSAEIDEMKKRQYADRPKSFSGGQQARSESKPDPKS